MMMDDEEKIEETKELIVTQLREIDPSTKGIITLTYGLENYMVSSNVAKKIFNGIAPALKEKFPDIVFILIPFYISMSEVMEMV